MRSSAILTALVLFGGTACGGATATSPSSDAAATTDYTMDFSRFPRGGFYSGNMYKVVFSLNLQQHDRIYDVPSGSGAFDMGLIPPNVAIGEVLGFACEGGTAKQLETELAYYVPPPGDIASIDHIDLEMLPDAVQGVPAGAGVVMCFGTRTPGGAWQWDLTPRAATWNPTEKIFRLHLAVPRRPVDAIEIVSSAGPGADLHVRVRKIVVATVPGG